MVDYTNSKGTVRGRTSGKKWNFSEIPYEPPRVLTKEEAAERGGFVKPKRLTGGANGGIIEHEGIGHSADYNVPEGLLESEAFRNKFKQMSDDPVIQEQYYNAAKEILTHRSGTNGEDLYYYNPRLGKWYLSKEGTQAFEPEYNAEIYTGLAECHKNELIAFHNHAASTPPSIDDINTAQQNSYNRGYIFCHDGRIFEYDGSSLKVSRAEFAEYAIWFRNKKDLSDIEARIQAIELLSSIYDFDFRELV